MNLEVFLVSALVGGAVAWLVRRWLATFRRRRDGGCAGGCGCAPKVGRKG